MPNYLPPSEVVKLGPGLTEAKLSQMRFKRIGPRFYKPTAKTVLYEEGEFRAWLASTAVDTEVA